MIPTIAYISQGRLFLLKKDGCVDEVECKFANGVIARKQKNAEQESWKSESVWGSGGMGMPEFAQFGKAAQQAGVKVRFLHVCNGSAPGQIYYVVQMDDVVGVFEYVPDEDREIRLLHRNQFYLQYLFCPYYII